MSPLRESLRSPLGKAVAVVLLLASAAALYGSVRAFIGESPAATHARERVFMCSQTGRTFSGRLEAGMMFPVHSPHSGAATGYPAEFCYWTADGGSKEEATPVIVRESMGLAGPTFCPDCDRLVVGHNPRPEPGRRPPPKREQLPPGKVAER